MAASTWRVFSAAAAASLARCSVSASVWGLVQALLELVRELALVQQTSFRGLLEQVLVEVLVPALLGRLAL